MRLKIEKEDYNTVVSLYQSGLSLEKIGKVYGVNKSSIKTVLNKMNIKTRDNSHKGRKYTINENYFDNIDTPNKAYILGLLYSDGCNYRKANHVKLELQESDKEILEKIKREMNINNPLKLNELSKKNTNWQNTYRLSIVNKHVSETLESLGVIPNKSLKIVFPKWLPDELLPHFLRGYVDGDGHIQCYVSRHVSLVGTENFCLTVKEKLKNIGIKSTISNTQNKETSTRILYICGIANITNFLDYIYDSAELYIDRKYNAYKAFLKETNNTNNSLSA